MSGGNYSLGVAQGAIIISYDGKGVKAAQAGLAGVKAETRATGLSAAALGKSMTKSGLVMAAGLAVAVKTATDFQSKMNLLVTAAGESPKAIASVAKGLQQLAILTGTSLDQMADGMYLAEKAGYRAAAGLKVMRAAAEGARAENVDLATFTSALTSVMTSYSYKADDATRVTNMLVRAAGASKTTMTEFAGSLATVLPIASALGISFPQVAGAIATLTQHGTTAREATQEIANLIRNLAGQNNVAKAALESLHIRVVDLQKSLGKRGLSGTLAIVTEALKRHGKAGQIVTSAFKQSATATQAMDTMLAHMPANLATLSRGFAQGKVSMKEYRTGFRDLGGPASVMGQQFLGLYTQSKGFSNQLKSGNPQVQNLVSILSKALGGATGLRTALQLGVSTNKEASKSAGIFATTIKDVAEAGKHGGKNISTWAQTSQTAAVKLGRLKAAGEVFGVTMGNIVLPAVTKVVTALAHFLVWLTNLPEPLKHVLGYGTLIAAAFLLLGGLFIKLVSFGKRLYEAMVLLGRGFSRAIAAVESLLVKLGIIPSAEAKAALAATEAGLQQEEAAAAVATAYEESVASIEAAELQLQEALTGAAEVANGTATEQEAAAARVAAAQEELASVAVTAEERVAAAELAAAEAAQRAAAITAEAMAAQTAAVTEGVAAQEAALGGLAATRAGGAVAGGAPIGAVGAGRRFSGGGFALGAGAFLGGSYLSSKGGTAKMIGQPLQYAGAGAAVGSFAGPVGVAVGAGIGAIVGGLKDLWDWTHKVTDAQKQLNRVNKDAGDNTANFTESYFKQGKASRDLAKNAAALALSHTDLAKKAAKAGLTEGDLQLAITGTNKEYNAVIETWKRQGKPAKETIEALGELHDQYGAAGEVARRFALDMGIALPGWKKTGTGAQLVSGKLVNLLHAYDTAASTSLDFKAALGQISVAARENTTTLDQSTSLGRKNGAVFRTAAADALAHAQAIYKSEVATKGQHQATLDAIASLKTSRQKLIDAAVAAGFNKDEVQKLIDKLHTIPHNPKSTIHINTEQAKHDTSDFISWFTSTLLKVHPTITPRIGKPVGVPGVDYPALVGANHNYGNNSNLGSPDSGNNPQGTRSSGGWIPGPSTRRWKGTVHGREYVLSTDMLRGRRPVDARVLQALSHGQRLATSQRRGTFATALPSSPASVVVRGSSGGSTGPKRMHIASGELAISADSTGALRGWVQDLILAEHDYADDLAGMH